MNDDICQENGEKFRRWILYRYVKWIKRTTVINHSMARYNSVIPVRGRRGSESTLGVRFNGRIKENVGTGSVACTINGVTMVTMMMINGFVL